MRRWRLADADAQPDVIGGAEMLGDRPQAIVASKAAARLDLDPTGVEIEFVVDDDELVGILNAVATSQQPN